MKYDFSKIEKKWQKRWLKEKVFKANNGGKKPKYYQLETFPYPSAAGLHVGHPKGYIAEDIHARYMRMRGYNVLYTMGWDAFGLPTENYAIKIGKSPQEVAAANIKNFRKQIRMFGLSYDWDREINTSDPDYYKWTQWLFIQLFKKGLAYRAKAKVNWCPKDQTVLANEQVINGQCERDGEAIVQKDMEQWFLKITDYAERLLADLRGLDWPAATVKRQEDWIGKSEGAIIEFSIQSQTDAEKTRTNAEGQRKSAFSQHESEVVKVFTTRPDTLFGATYMVLAPEHQLIKNLESRIQNPEEVKRYIEAASHKTELMRQEEVKEKTGVELKGVKAINPATKEEIPVWIADYVLMGYGTGAIMAVPAHDERDFEFAKKFNLPVREVIRQVCSNCVLVHGCPKEPRPDRPFEQNWKLWIKKELEKKGIKAFTPRMPEAWKPRYSAWKKELEKIPINETSILIGNSCGAAFLVRWIGETKTKVQKLILVAPALIAKPNDQSKKDLYDFEISPNIKEYIGESVILISNDEERHLKSAQIYKNVLGARVIKLENKGHFTFNEMGTNRLPELLREILEPDDDRFSEVFIGEGAVINSGNFDGMDSEKARWEITKFVGGKKKIQYKIRDWSVSRQRYWGAPIPMIHCPKCGVVPVPEEDLPILLPKIKNYRPQGTPPLASSEEFMNAPCPKCGGGSKRDPETLDTFVDSSWYYLRYPDPWNEKEIFDKKKADYWLPADLYVIGAEHTVLHLLYSRFITKFIHDEGYLGFAEPFVKLRHPGLIRGADGQKMSKSKGNVINPDTLIEEFGADTLRVYEMFMGPFEDGQPWDSQGILGAHRFLFRFFQYVTDIVSSPKFGKEATPPAKKTLVHKAIKKISADIENFKFNTAISALMILLNELAGKDSGAMGAADAEILIKLLHPFAPHLAQELWDMIGNETYIDFETWPEYDRALVKDEKFTLVVQVNGKVRDNFEVGADMGEEEIKILALGREKIKNIVGTQKPKKSIYVIRKLVNIVL